MSFKVFVTTVIIGSVLSWLGFFLILTNVDPTRTDHAAFLFYITLALSLFGTLTTVGLSLRRIIIRDDSALLRHLKQSVRQATLLTTAAILVLKFLSVGLFAWWIGLLLMLLIFMIEAVFYSRRTVTSGYV